MSKFAGGGCLFFEGRDPSSLPDAFGEGVSNVSTKYIFKCIYKIYLSTGVKGKVSISHDRLVMYIVPLLFMVDTRRTKATTLYG